jgi:hypothetical protein
MGRKLRKNSAYWSRKKTLTCSNPRISVYITLVPHPYLAVLSGLWLQMGRNSEATQSSGVQRRHLLLQTLELVCIYVLCLIPTQSLWAVWLQMGRNSDPTQSSGVQRRHLLAQTLELVCIYVLCPITTQSLWGVWLQMVRNSESGVQRRHLFAQTLELVLCDVSLHNISVDIHIHYSTSRQIKSKYSEKHKGEKS